MSFSIRTSAALIGLLSVLGGSVMPRPAVSAPDTNLLAPLSDAKSWRLQVSGKAHATLTRDSGDVVITTQAVDGVPYHALFQCYSPALEEGQLYTLRFRAKADADRTLPIYALIVGGDSHEIGLHQAAELSAEWRPFEYTFRVKGRGDKTRIVCPQFTVGNATGTVSLSDISVTPATPGTAVTPFWALQRFDPAEASLKTDGSTEMTTITRTDGEPWHVQLAQLNASVKDGITSIVTFRAKANVPRDMMLAGAVSDSDYHAICDQQYVALNTSWRNYTFRVTPRSSAGHPLGFPQFLLGKQTGVVWIDQVTVTTPGDSDTRAAAAPIPLTPAAPAALLLPQKGELRVDGIIASQSFGPTGFTLLVRRIIQSDGKIVTLTQSRPKVIRLNALTSYRATQEKDAAGFSQASLKPGDAVSVIGPDAGVGKPLPARLVLR